MSIVYFIGLSISQDPHPTVNIKWGEMETYNRRGNSLHCSNNNWRQNCIWQNKEKKTLFNTKPPAPEPPNLLGLSKQWKLHIVVVRWQVTGGTRHVTISGTIRSCSEIQCLLKARFFLFSTKQVNSLIQMSSSCQRFFSLNLTCQPVYVKENRNILEMFLDKKCA